RQRTVPSSSPAAPYVFDHQAVFAAAARLQRFQSTGGVDGNGGQEPAKGRRGAPVEAEPGPFRQLCDLSIRGLSRRIISFLKQEDRHTAQAEISGPVGEFVRILLHRVAYIDQGIYLLTCVLSDRVCQHLSDLCTPATTVDPRHQAFQALGIPDETRGATFAETAEIDELYI